MVRDHPGAPAAYPEINNATRPLRGRRGRGGRPGHMSLYAGTGFRGAERVRRPRWWSGWRRDCGGERAARRPRRSSSGRPTWPRSPTRWPRCATAGSGWINLLPGIDEDAAEPEPPAGLFAFFGNRAPPVTMATVMPPRRTGSAAEGVTVGLMHPTGAKAVARLAEAGVAVPDGWVVRQDHARRGLLLRTPPDADDADIVTWCVAAGTALCLADMTGQWRAVVYLP